jgi:hypothetical protein
VWAVRPVLRALGSELERTPLPFSNDRTHILAIFEGDGTLSKLRPNLDNLKAADIKILEGPQASLTGLVGELNIRNYDVLLLHCWLDWNPQSRRVGLFLADGVARRERLQEVVLSSLPPVVILGAFWAGWEQTPLELAEALEELAELFRSLGSRLVVANLWPFPEWGKQVGELLQAALLGRPLLQSLLRIRTQQAQLAAGPWMGEWSWLVWGEEDLVLPGQATAGTKISAMQPTHVLQVEEGVEPGKRFQLRLVPGRQIYLGRPGIKGVDVSLPSDILENRSAALTKVSQGLVLRNLTEDPDLVSINGLPVVRDCSISPGDRLRLGDHILLLQELGESGATAAAGQEGYLEIVRWDLDEPPTQDVVPLSATVTTLGRSNECRLIIPDASVSRVHAAIKWRGESYFLSALGSNPVIVNGVVVEGERELDSGDVILVSEAVELLFRWAP